MLTDLVQRAKLVASDGRELDRFGTSVAISGETLVVGAEYDVVGSKRTGSVYVFVEPTLGWSGVRETAKLTASDGTADGGFGWVVAISGDTVVVAAPFANAGAAGTEGAAYVFVKPAGGWRDMTETAKLTASDAAFQDDFGSSAAIDGDTIVVGAPTEDGGTGNHFQGSAYVFVKPPGGWTTMTETAKLTTSDGAAEDGLGNAVGVSGNTVVAGAPGDGSGSATDVGAAYVYVRPVAGWTSTTETAKLTAGDGQELDRLGRAVSVDGDTIAVGAYLSNVGPANSAGSVYVFVEPAGGWSSGAAAVAELTALDGMSMDQLGTSVAVRNDTIVAGAVRGGGSGGAHQGAAYLFTRPAGGWTTSTETRKLTAADGADSDKFAFSVAIDDGTVVAGAGAATVDSDAHRGAAYVFAAPVAVPATTPLATLALATLLAAAACVLLRRRARRVARRPGGG